MHLDGAGVQSAIEAAGRLRAAVATVVLGQDDHVPLVLAGVLAGGHVLLEDAPGVGKTLLAKSLARALGGTVGRVQGTPDLLPADVVGVSTWQPGSGEWVFRPGPVFHNVLLVDEINRATPRAQSALLEAMQEHTTTVDGSSRPLPDPFIVLATQNPLGDVGTYPLVAGQLDRFAVAVSLGLPDRAAERSLLAGQGGVDALDDLQPVTTPAELRSVIDAVARDVVVAPAVLDYTLDLGQAVRERSGSPTSPSPRAVLTLLAVARAHAVIAGRGYVAPDDVKAMAVPVLAHRLTDPSDVVAALDVVPVPVG